MIDKKTGFSVPIETKNRLDALKLTSSESNENTIVRLIEKHWGGMKNEQQTEKN